MHLAGDIATKDYPARNALLREFRSGHIPTWDGTQFAGWPGIANCESSPLYPPNIILLLSWQGERFPYRVFEWFAIGHLIFAGWGAMRLGRRLGLSSTAAVLTGLSFGCTGFLIANRLYVNVIQVMAWYPWAWWALEGAIGRRRLIDLLTLIAVLFCLFTAGHPQMAIYVFLVLLTRTVHATWNSGLGRGAPDGTEQEAASIATGERLSAFLARMFPFLGAFVLAGLLVSAAWFPFFHLASLGERASATYEFTTELALPAEELIDLVLPDVLPPVPETSGQHPLHYWGVQIFYVGLIPLFLAAIALPSVRRGRASEAVLLIACAGTLLALGPATKLHDLLYLSVPGMSGVRMVSRWMGIVALPVALAAGQGTHVLLGRKPGTPWPKWLLGAGGAWLAILVLLAVIVVAVRVAFGTASANADRFLEVLVTALIFSLLFGLVVWLRDTRRIDNGILCLGLGLLLWLDLARHPLNVDLREGPTAYVTDEAVEEILSTPIPVRTKIFLRWGIERELYSGAVFGFEELDGESPLKTRDSTEITALTALSDPLRINHSFLDLLGTRYLLTDVENPGGPWKPAKSRFLWVNPDASPRARFCGDWIGLELPAAADLASVTDRALLERGYLSIQAFPNRDAAMIFGAETIRPQQAVAWPVGETGVTLAGSLLVHSSSNDGVLPQALIAVNGRSVSPNRKGYNVVVLDPGSGECVDSDVFNLDVEAENERMLRFVQDVPGGFVVVFAIHDESTNLMREPALKALRQCGSQLDLSQRYRMAHVVVGAKGAHPGTALEVASATEALVVVMDRGRRVIDPEPVGKREATRLVTVAGLDKPAWDLYMRQEDRLSRRPVIYRLGGERYSVPIDIYSAPPGPGGSEYAAGWASIRIGGVETALNRTGYNLVAVDPTSWKVLASEAFNLGEDYDATLGLRPGTPMNRAMCEFIERFPPGTLIAGAIRDNAMNLLQRPTVNALQGIGLGLEMPPEEGDSEAKRYRWAHVFVGVVGASAGTGVEVTFSEPCALLLAGESEDVPGHIPDRLDELPANRRFVSGVVPKVRESAFSRAGTEREEPAFPLTKEAGPQDDETEPTWTFTIEKPGRVVCEGWAPSDGWLVTSERFFPGWRATVDGEPAAIRRAHRYVRMVWLEEGFHRVVWRYDSPGWLHGMILSLAAFVVFAGIFVYHWTQRRCGKTPCF